MENNPIDFAKARQFTIPQSASLTAPFAQGGLIRRNDKSGVETLVSTPLVMYENYLADFFFSAMTMATTMPRPATPRTIHSQAEPPDAGSVTVSEGTLSLEGTVVGAGVVTVLDATVGSVVDVSMGAVVGSVAGMVVVTTTELPVVTVVVGATVVVGLTVVGTVVVGFAVVGTVVVGFAVVGTVVVGLAVVVAVVGTVVGTVVGVVGALLAFAENHL